MPRGRAQAWWQQPQATLADREVVEPPPISGEEEVPPEKRAGSNPKPPSGQEADQEVVEPPPISEE
jgi:hypothetical protein